MNLNVRISGKMEEHLNAQIESGYYNNASEYVRDLIREKMLKKDEDSKERLDAYLKEVSSIPESDFKPFILEDFLAHMEKKYQ